MASGMGHAIIEGLFTDQRAGEVIFQSREDYEGQGAFIARVGQEAAEWLHTHSRGRRVVRITIMMEG